MMDTSKRFRSGPRLWLTALATLTFAAACTTGSRAVTDSPTASQAGTAPPGPTPSATNVQTANPVATWQITRPGGISFGFGSAWLPDGDRVLRIDPQTNKTIATVKVGVGAAFSFLALGSVWVATAVGTYRINPATNKVVGTIPHGRIFGEGSLWDVDASGRLLRIDPASGKTVAEIAVQGSVDWQPELAMGFGSVWVGSGDEHKVIRVDTKTNKVVARIGGVSTDYSLLPVGVGFGSVWAHANAAGSSGILYRVDPATNKVVASEAVGDAQHGGQYGGTDVAFGDGSVWTADSSPAVSRVDPKTNAVIATVGVAVVPEYIEFGYGSIWVDTKGGLQQLRIDAAAFGPAH